MGTLCPSPPSRRLRLSPPRLRRSRSPPSLLSPTTLLLPLLLSLQPQLSTTSPSQLSTTFSTLNTSLSPRLTPTPSLLESRGRSTPLITLVALSPLLPLWWLRPMLRMPPPSLRLKKLPTTSTHYKQ